MRILLIEDEELALKKLRNLLKALGPDISIVGETDSITSSVSWLRSNPAPDLALMDIELADGQSFEIFDRVEVKCPVIFTTSYDEYAIQAFKVNSVAYLLKPIEKEELAAALEKYEQMKEFYSTRHPGFSIDTLVQELQVRLQPKEYRKRFLVKNGTRLVSIDVNDISYFFSEGKLIFFRTTDNKKFVTDYTMDEIQNMADPDKFFRINRSFLISQDCITKIDDYFGQRLALQLQPSCPGETIVSREKVSAFKTWMGK